MQKLQKLQWIGETRRVGQKLIGNVTGRKATDKLIQTEQ